MEPESFFSCLTFYAYVRKDLFFLTAKVYGTRKHAHDSREFQRLQQCHGSEAIKRSFEKDTFKRKQNGLIFCRPSSVGQYSMDMNLPHGAKKILTPCNLTSVDPVYQQFPVVQNLIHSLSLCSSMPCVRRLLKRFRTSCRRMHLENLLSLSSLHLIELPEVIQCEGKELKGKCAAETHGTTNNLPGNNEKNVNSRKTYSVVIRPTLEQQMKLIYQASYLRFINQCWDLHAGGSLPVSSEAAFDRVSKPSSIEAWAHLLGKKSAPPTPPTSVFYSRGTRSQAGVLKWKDLPSLPYSLLLLKNCTEVDTFLSYMSLVNFALPHYLELVLKENIPFTKYLDDVKFIFARGRELAFQKLDQVCGSKFLSTQFLPVWPAADGVIVNWRQNLQSCELAWAYENPDAAIEDFYSTHLPQKKRTQTVHTKNLTITWLHHVLYATKLYLSFSRSGFSALSSLSPTDVSKKYFFHAESWCPKKKQLDLSKSWLISISLEKQGIFSLPTLKGFLRATSSNDVPLRRSINQSLSEEVDHKALWPCTFLQKKNASDYSFLSCMTLRHIILELTHVSKVFPMWFGWITSRSKWGLDHDWNKFVSTTPTLPMKQGEEDAHGQQRREEVWINSPQCDMESFFMRSEYIRCTSCPLLCCAPSVRETISFLSQDEKGSFFSKFPARVFSLHPHIRKGLAWAEKMTWSTILYWTSLVELNFFIPWLDRLRGQVFGAAHMQGFIYSDFLSSFCLCTGFGVYNPSSQRRRDVLGKCRVEFNLVWELCGKGRPHPRLSFVWSD